MPTRLSGGGAGIVLPNSLSLAPPSLPPARGGGGLLGSNSGVFVRTAAFGCREIGLPMLPRRSGSFGSLLIVNPECKSIARDNVTPG